MAAASIRSRRASREWLETPSELYHRRRSGQRSWALESEKTKAQQWTLLQSNPEVQRVLDDWWVATDSDGNGVIDHAEYLELGKALYRLMIGDGDEAAALESAESDWRADCQGQSVMDRELCKQAIFELCAPRLAHAS
jgi:hypothetical protein